MKLFDFDGPLMTTLRKLWAIVGASVLFIVCCLPVVTAGLSFTALYTVAEKNLKNNRGYVWSEFTGALKNNWRQALPAGAVMAAVLFVFEVDVRILKAFLMNGHAIGNLYVLVRVLQVLLIIYAVWVFAQIAVFENTLKQILKNSLLLMISHLGSSVVIFLLLLFAAAVIWVIPISAALMPAVVTWLMTASLEKVFGRYGE